MSAKIAVISSITWLIGWMRPRSAGDWRTGRVTSTLLGGQPRLDRRVLQDSTCGQAKRLGDAVLQAVDRRACGLAFLRRSCAQRLQRSETEPFLPSAATRTASMALHRGRRDVGKQAAFQNCRFSVSSATTPPLYGSLRCPPSTSPPQGGRSAGRVFANQRRRPNGEVEAADLPPCGGDVRQEGGQCTAPYMREYPVIRIGSQQSQNKEKPAPALPARVSQIRLSNAWEALA
jgi:hypothetical protein